MEKKADSEDAYFRQCQREASGRGGGTSQMSRSEAELFKKQGAQGINFDNYDKIDVEVKGLGADAVEALQNFKDLGSALPPFLVRNVGLMNYERPTPIQKHAVPLALAGYDLMCCAQTGSGKTCAFLLPVASALGREDKLSGHVAPVGSAALPRCVVMAPTRELASQINVEAEKLCSRSGLRPVVVYGGADQRKQIRDLAFGVDIIVATPGRLTDFVERQIVSLSNVSFLVLDEADRMLDMGFEPQIRRIVLQADMPPKESRQTLLFSATFAPEIQKLAAAFLRQYIWIAVGRVGSTVENIEQRLVKATNDKRHKLRLVVQALAQASGRTLVFVQKKRTATWLKKQLRKGGPDDGNHDERFEPVMAEDIHGDRSQSQRESALRQFREGHCRVLVATDVAARGLDIAGVEHVINMDLPFAKDDFDSYVHRIGRTGRAGHMGLATSFYVPGMDPKSGNGAIARSLLQQLRETGSEVPSWFESLPECGSGSGGGGGKKKFGGSDVRSSGKQQQQQQQHQQHHQQHQQHHQQQHQQHHSAGGLGSRNGSARGGDSRGRGGGGVRKGGSSGGRAGGGQGMGGGRPQSAPLDRKRDAAMAALAGASGSGSRGGGRANSRRGRGRGGGGGSEDVQLVTIG